MKAVACACLAAVLTVALSAAAQAQESKSAALAKQLSDQKRAEMQEQTIQLSHAMEEARSFETRGSEQSLDHTLIVLLEYDQARTGRTFLSLITEGGINSIDDRLIEICVGIDNDRVLASHLTYDALELALSRPRFARRFPDP